MSLSSSERERYRRHLALSEIGAAGQEKLKAARVLIVGAGGLGSPAALYLAAAGCGTLGLLDCDRVDLTNLQRQVLFDSESIGQLKAEAGRERLAALNPELRIVAHAAELRAANVREVFAQYGLVLDGTDRLSTRYLINDACVIMRRPLVSAAIHRFEGHLITYVPDRGPCYRCLFPQAMDGMVADCARRPECLVCCPACSACFRRPRPSSSLPASVSRSPVACSPTMRSRCASASFG